MENAFAETAEKTLSFFKVQIGKGRKSNDIPDLQLKYGKNELPKEEATPLWKLILQQFEDQVKLSFKSLVSNYFVGCSGCFICTCLFRTNGRRRGTFLDIYCLC